MDEAFEDEPFHDDDFYEYEDPSLEFYDPRKYHDSFEIERILNQRLPFELTEKILKEAWNEHFEDLQREKLINSLLSKKVPGYPLKRILSILGKMEEEDRCFNEMVEEFRLMKEENDCRHCRGNPYGCCC